MSKPRVTVVHEVPEAADVETHTLTVDELPSESHGTALSAPDGSVSEEQVAIPPALSPDHLPPHVCLKETTFRFRDGVVLTTIRAGQVIVDQEEIRALLAAGRDVVPVTGDIASVKCPKCTYEFRVRKTDRGVFPV